MNTTTNAASPSNGSIGGYLLSSLSALFWLTLICCGVYPLVVWGIAQGIFPHQANGSLLAKDGRPTTDDHAAVGSALIGQQFTAAKYFHPRPSAANNSAGTSFSATGGYDPTSSGGTNYGPLNDTLLNGATTRPSAPTTAPAAPATVPATLPAEVVAYDGVRLRTLHYAVDNGLTFTLTNGNGVTVPLKAYQNADGTLNDTALIHAFPHPNDPTSITDLTATDFRTADGRPVTIPADAVTASGSGLDPHISPTNADFQAARIATARHMPLDRVRQLITQYTDEPVLGLGDPGVNVLRLNLALDAEQGK